MQITLCSSNDKNYQKLLSDLLKPIFLDFQFYYDLNLWNSDYESYSVILDDKIVSNICGYKTRILFRGREYEALSIGAVATREGFRGKGYSRAIMEYIIDKYENTPMYLSANESVLDFYPRFGFSRVYEKLPVADYAVDNALAPKMLRYDDPKVWDYVYKRINYSKELDCLNAAPTNLFHIYWGYLRGHIYEIPELETIIIANQNQTGLKIIGVFALKEYSFADLARFLPFSGVMRIGFGFTPYWDDLKYEMVVYESDPFFIRNVNCDLGDFKFPELSIT